MQLLLVRDVFLADATLGVLTVDGKAFGFVCEDEDRGLDAANAATLARKVRRETAIPVGRYRVRKTWSDRFKRDVLEVKHVSGFGGIRIHAGNDDDDTEGCLLPGLARDVRLGVVSRSRNAVRWLELEYDRRTAKGEETWIEITRDEAAWAAFTRAG